MDNGKRRHKACDPCSQRKVRCNGRQRCQQCEHLNLPCKYSAAAPRSQYQRRSRKPARKLRNPLQAIAALATSASVHGSSRTAGTNGDSMQYQATAELSDGDFFVALLSDFGIFVLPFHPAITMSEAQSAIETMSENQEARAFVKTNPESSDISKWVSMSLDALTPILLQENISVRRVATLQFLHVCFMGLGRYDIAFYYLRQSVAMLEILRIRDSSSMLVLPFTERSQRQRLYWTVFIHERFYAIACRRPALLHPLETLPEPDVTIPIDINIGFIQIIRLFLHIDDDMLSKWFATFDSEQRIDLSWVPEKHQQIEAETAGGLDEVACLSNRQQVDLLITKHWMRILVWQIAMSKCLLSSGSSEQSMSLSFPIGISKHLRDLIASVSKQDIEVHGSGIQQKLFELTDATASVVLTVPASSPEERRQRVDDFNFLSRFWKSLPRPNAVQEELLESKHSKLAEVELGTAGLEPCEDRTETSRWELDRSGRCHAVRSQERNIWRVASLQCCQSQVSRKEEPGVCDDRKIVNPKRPQV
ncbi:hypothetical protein D0859_11242 [Hortaea werneckii]|uniref:Zn(2)-C6 fungal-type domain-containing protein n=1 Tax=Hortaea werneckii TaxID=91943 RepID=A0A3M7IHA5_HORWE|nr:hypothetical protein D0859_11242 [Hortaea werneckii]